jgi:hypothetical protein
MVPSHAAPACKRASVRGSARREALIAFVAVALVCAWIWRGAFDAGWISEDTSVVRHLATHAGAADWFQAQYGMSSIRFWRPLVTASLELQLWLTGADPAAMRLLNMTAHLVGAYLVYWLARALNGGSVGSLAAALAAATFPFQGGTAIWIVGRVDALAWPLVVAAAIGAARGRGLVAALFVVLALATKEIGAAAVPLALAAAWCAPHLDVARRRRIYLWIVAGAVLALTWRAFALGTFVGGYPGTDLFAAPLAAARHGIAALGALPGVVVFVALLGLLARSIQRRVLIVGVVGALGALAVVAPLLADGVPRLEHRRWLIVPDGCVCLAAGALIGRLRVRANDPVRAIPALAATLLVVAGIGWRTADAREDVVAWTRASVEAQAFVDRLAATLANEPARTEPLFAVDVPRLSSDGRAYTLHLGLADRFRAPIAAPGPREVWPWRPFFGNTELPAPAPVRGGAWRVEDVVATLALEGPLDVQLRGDDSGGIVFAPTSAADAAGLRVVLATEIGYDVAPLPAAGPTGWNVHQILGASGATQLWRTLMFAGEAGARRAWFAFVASDGRVSRFVELTFDDATVELLRRFV